MDKIVVIGTTDVLVRLRGLYSLFRENGWEVIECETIGDAKRIKGITAMVVYAYGNDHVAEFVTWIDHPKTIWFTFARQDVIPNGTNAMHAVVLPSELYNNVRQMVGSL